MQRSQRLPGIQQLANAVAEYINERPGKLFKGRDLHRVFNYAETNLCQAFIYIRKDNTLFWHKEGKVFYYWSKYGEARTK